MSTRDLIDKEVALLPEDLQRKVYDFAVRLKQRGSVGNARVSKVTAEKFDEVFKRVRELFVD